MEHRLGCRVALSLPVELWRGDRLVGTAVSRNLGHGGACIVGIDAGVSPGDFVTVKIRAQAEYSVKAMVLYQRSDEMGVMWASDEKALHDEIDVIRRANTDATPLTSSTDSRQVKRSSYDGLLKNAC